MLGSTSEANGICYSSFTKVARFAPHFVLWIYVGWLQFFRYW